MDSIFGIEINGGTIWISSTIVYGAAFLLLLLLCVVIAWAVLREKRSHSD